MENEERYVIKNVKYNVFYNKSISNNLYHFVREMKDAKIFKKEDDARKVLEEVLKNNSKYVIVKC